MHTSSGGYPRSYCQAGKPGGKVQRSEAQRFLAGVLSTQVPFPRGQQGPDRDKGVLEEAVFVLSLSARGGGEAGASPWGS